MALIAALLGIDGAPRYGPLGLSPQQQRLGTVQGAGGRAGRRGGARDRCCGRSRTCSGSIRRLWSSSTCASRGIARLPVLILTSARPDFHYALRQPAEPDATTALPARPYADRGDGEGSDTAARPCRRLLLDEIAAKSDGVPLFIEELTKTVLESGVLHETEDGYIVDDPAPSLAIPASLRDSLMARLDRLQPVKEVAQTAACIGREFNDRLLAAIMPPTATGLDDALARLIEAELIFSASARRRTVSMRSSTRWYAMPHTRACSRPSASKSTDGW